MEMAAASGLTLVPPEMRDPRKTTTFGTGEMIRDALDRGFRDISVAIGGSATNDGGTGCMKALGIRFLDADGKEVDGCGEDLIRICDIDGLGLDPRVSECRFTVMCDVSNPLCGADGATYTFGRQKGGTPEILDGLEAGMQNYRDIIKEEIRDRYGLDTGSGSGGRTGRLSHGILKGGAAVRG